MTPTLYDSGMSQDVLWIVNELRKEGLKEICLAGWSMGGNIILKAAAELGEHGPETPALQSEFITLIATDHGGHGGFLQKEPENEPDLDHFWAENRAITYLKSKTSQAGAKSYLEFI